MPRSPSPTRQEPPAQGQTQQGLGSPEARPRLREGRRGWGGDNSQEAAGWRARALGEGSSCPAGAMAVASPGGGVSQTKAQAEQVLGTRPSVHSSAWQRWSQVSWAPHSWGAHVPLWPADTTTHQPRAPDYVPLSWLPRQSRAKGKGQRSRFRVQAAEKPKQSRA